MLIKRSKVIIFFRIGTKITWLYSHKQKSLKGFSDVKNAMLRLAVTVVGKVLELSAIAEPADVFLGGLGWNF